jgi:hypothetical protein
MDPSGISDVLVNTANAVEANWMRIKGVISPGPRVQESFEELEPMPDLQHPPWVEATASLQRTAKKKGGKVKARSRGSCVFPSTHGSVKDNKDHYPINSISQARNALARASQHKGSPPWYSGSLQGLVSAVRGAVKRKYPSIEVTEKSKKPKKGSFDRIDKFLSLRGSLADVMGELKKTAQPAELIREWEEKAPPGKEHEELFEAGRQKGEKILSDIEPHEDLPKEVKRIQPEETQWSASQRAGEAPGPVEETGFEGDVGELQTRNLMTAQQNIQAAAKKLNASPWQVAAMVAEKEQEEGMALTVDEIVECCGEGIPLAGTFGEVSGLAHGDVATEEDEYLRMLLDAQRREQW